MPIPTSGRPTVYTVAERAGVSVATVSRVMADPDRVSGSTKERVLRAIDDLDYVPHGAARSLASRQHEAHGLVLPELGGPYYSELLMGYESVAAEAGQSVLLLLTEGKADVDARMRRLAAKVDGIVLMSGVPVAPRTIETLIRKVPVVGLGARDEADLETFSTESRTSAEQLTRHLIEHGRRRIVFVGTPEAAPDVQQRYEGYVAAHDGADTPAHLPVGFREGDGRAVADRLLAGEVEADALFCANDELAVAVIDRLHGSRLEVPTDLAVVGWDDVMTARYVRPALTTVAQPVRELGARIATRLGDLIAGQPATDDSGAADSQHLLPTRLVIRQSCGCPPT